MQQKCRFFKLFGYNKKKAAILFFALLIVCLSFFLSIFYIQQSQGKTFYVLRSNEGAGMFADFNAVLGFLDFYENKKKHLAGINVDFQDKGLYFEPERGRNWWEYYFEPISLGKVQNARVMEITFNKHCSFTWKGCNLPRSRARKLIQKYIKVKPHIQNKVDDFVDACFRNHFIIGVHYRGTDKVLEAPLVPFKLFESQIQEYVRQAIEKKIPYKIFVATDEQEFLEKIKERFPDHVLCLNAIRAEDCLPIHFINENRYRKGEEALIDCLLLSQCAVLVCNRSNLNTSSGQFNPDLSIIRLNQMYREKDSK